MNLDCDCDMCLFVCYDLRPEMFQSHKLGICVWMGALAMGTLAIGTPAMGASNCA